MCNKIGFPGNTCNKIGSLEISALEYVLIEIHAME
jgi:hypothetical protein